jgi:predicted NBD/HSP70 family sugar kinase
MYRDGGVNAPEQRIRNRSLILQSLLLRGPSSRQDLASATGLTAATVSRIADEVTKQGLIQTVVTAGDPGAERRLGRPSVLIDVDPGSVCVGSIYVAGAKAQIGIHDGRGAVIDHITVPVPEPDDAEGTLVALAAALQRLVDDRGVRDRLIRVGATVLGGVDEDGVVIVAHPGWHDVPAADILTRELSVPVVVDRMQHGLVTAEAWFGVGAGVSSVAALDVSDGIGAAIAIDGRVVTGFDHREGQLGHFVVPGLERVCQLCGLRGCLQEQIRDSAFARDARDLLDGAEQDDDPAVIDRLYTAARAGARDALELVETRARHIGYALALVTAVVDPELFVLSGRSVIGGWDLIGPIIKSERLQRSPLPHEARGSRVELTSFGHDAVLVGTASLALQHFYSAPELPRAS